MRSKIIDSGITIGKELHDLFVQLRNDFQQTFLIVTHNEELAAMSDRILHMKDGMVGKNIH